MVEFRRAVAEDAPRIAVTRQKVWAETYRGIYPDEMIDQFDYAWHEERDRVRIEKENVWVWLVTDGSECVGYYTYGDILGDGSFWLMSLYLRKAYQRQGLGTKIFQRILADCHSRGHRTMCLECDPQNQNAMDFYRRMGGVIKKTDAGHDNPMEDSVYFEFT